MGESFFIIAERPIGTPKLFGGTNLFHVGGALIDSRLVGDPGRRGRAPMSHLDALAREAGVRPLSEFVSEDPESPSATGGREALPYGTPPSQWFTAAEGLATVRGLLDYLTTHTDALAEVKRVIGELRQFQEVLRELDDEGVGWHLEDVSWW